jgi:hypothetical protein
VEAISSALGQNSQNAMVQTLIDGQVKSETEKCLQARETR